MSTQITLPAYFGNDTIQPVEKSIIIIIITVIISHLHTMPVGMMPLAEQQMQNNSALLNQKETMEMRNVKIFT